DEARRDQCIRAVVRDLRSFRQRARYLGGRSDSKDPAVLDDDDRIRPMDHRPVETVAERITGEGDRRPADTGWLGVHGGWSVMATDVGIEKSGWKGPPRALLHAGHSMAPSGFPAS